MTRNLEINRLLLGILALLLAFASLSTDLYLPAMPTMVDDLEASHGELEFTVSGFLLGFALGQLIWGPLSDRTGRKATLLAGLVLFTFGSAGCGFADTSSVLIGFRLIQAFGASACVVVARAIVNDLFDRQRAARVLSLLTAIMVIAPMLGPSIGAQILEFGSWRSIFCVLVVLGFCTLVMVARLVPESLRVDQRVRRPVTEIARNYRTLLSNQRFITYALAACFTSVGTFAYVAGSSFAFIDHYNVSPAGFAGIFAANSAGIILVNLLNSRLVARFDIDVLLRVGTGISGAAGLLVLLTSFGLGGVAGLAAALFLFVASSGLVMANAVSGGMASSTVGAGVASAVLGCMQYGGGFAGSAILGTIANGTLYPLGCVVFAAGISAAFVGAIGVTSRQT